MILGIDPSLNGTALVLLRKDLTLEYLKIGQRTGGPPDPKLLDIHTKVKDFIEGEAIELCAFEGPSLGSTSKKHLLGQVAGVLRLAVITAGIPILTIPPRSMKLAIAGTGSAPKEQVAESVATTVKSELPKDTDVTDAAGLALLGLYFLCRQKKETLDSPITRACLETCITLEKTKEHKGLMAVLSEEN